MTTSSVPDLLPFRDRAFQDDPYPYFDQVRKNHPVYRSPDGFWVVSRYEDVSRLLFDRSLSVEELDLGPLSTMHNAVLASDPPKHTRLRRAASRWFTPKMVRTWVEVVEQETRQHLEKFISTGGHFDAAQDLAFPVTFRTMSRVLGVPFDSTEAKRTQHLNEVVNPALGASPNETEITAAGTAMGELLRQSEGLIAFKEANPGAGLIDALLELEHRGEMSRDETIATVQLLITVGYQDTTFLIANGLRLLSENEGLLAAYRDDPTARGAIINEMLRFDSPEQFVARKTTQPTVVGNVTIPAGDVVLLYLAAANRDPGVFEKPDVFNYKRDVAASKHLAFSAGLHACVGQVLVRAEAEAVFTVVVNMFSTLRLTGDVVTSHTDMFRTIDSVPLRAAIRN